jgi:membrane protein YdbS with pleckstrin-like domain
VRDGAKPLLFVTRVFLPVMLAIIGVLAIIAGHARTALAGAGVVLLGVAVTVWLINYMFRLSVQSNREREDEERAREYFDEHGRWPGE